MALNHPPYALPLAPLLVEAEIPPHLQPDYAACHQIMRAASKNYSFAARLLPPRSVPHVAALYAVMRIGDDRVDVTSGRFPSPLAAIEDWRDSYWRAFDTGDSHEPVLRAYVHTARQFHIAPDLLNSYFRAMIDDLTITRFPTFADLMHYMEGSAIPVGRAMTHILGTRTAHIADAYPAADALSIAMQLSNFWRDIGEDLQRGRVYIPGEDLQRFGLSEQDIAAGVRDTRMIRLLEFQFARTEVYYAQARAGVSLLASGRVGVMSALELYRAILPSIRRNEYDVYCRRAGTSKLRKIGLVGRAWWHTRSDGYRAG